ncbi:MAG: hypothetical protein MUC59_04680 [Saprospiraceae bacterium]|nr:hypothetical protein [Saprospiraceae bacterium]
MECFDLEKVLEDEAAKLKERRRLQHGDAACQDFEATKFGIAMSGGGIRSATINLGFLKTLNNFRILEKADYLSTVSGGGYTGAYVQATVKEEGGFDTLFSDEKINRLREYGNYFIPGQGKLSKLWNTLMLVIGYLVSLAMSLLSPATVVLAIYLLAKVLGNLHIFKTSGSLLNLNSANGQEFVNELMRLGLIGMAILVSIHMLANLVWNFNLNVSKWFNKAELLLAKVFLGFGAALLVVNFQLFDSTTTDSFQVCLLMSAAAVGLLLSGFMLNPNSLSFHRYYRKQLADAFLLHTSKCRNLLLREVFPQEVTEATKQEARAPYPLINTCLNLQNPGGDNKFKGAKASDYFLLSPLWSGSKLSGYVPTATFPGYKHMTLPAALTISAAAVNPGMGIYSNKLLSVLMTLFNARLGFWVNNPGSEPRKLFGKELPRWATYVVWWPSFFFKELFSKIGTDNRKLNISDGGHIENLAVYELLRRKCRLIMAVDAGADPLSSFADFENLTIRARNEMGIDICFRHGQDPVDTIRPKASSGYAQRRYAIADLLQIWEEFEVVDNGEVYRFDVKNKQGKVLKKGKKLEALVNYFYDKNDPNFLQFKVDLKAHPHELGEETYNSLRKIVEEEVRQKLAAKKGMTGMEKIKVGTLVYIKSSVTSPRKIFVPQFDEHGEVNLQFETFKYKIYHPEFPHESTADQFFDKVQWESYYQLGQYIAADVLKLPSMPGEDGRTKFDVGIRKLLDLFDGDRPIMEMDFASLGLVDASTGVAAADEEELLVPRGIEEEQAPEAGPPDEGSSYAPPSPAPTPQAAVVEEMQFKI